MRNTNVGWSSQSHFYAEITRGRSWPGFSQASAYSFAEA
jgi:hypothetical protein